MPITRATRLSAMAASAERHKKPVSKIKSAERIKGPQSRISQDIPRPVDPQHFDPSLKIQSQLIELSRAEAPTNPRSPHGETRPRITRKIDRQGRSVLWTSYPFETLLQRFTSLHSGVLLSASPDNVTLNQPPKTGLSQRTERCRNCRFRRSRSRVTAGACK